MIETAKRPNLTTATTLNDLTNFYWYKEELVRFCVAHHLPASGQKHELLERIRAFLKTGRRPDKKKTEHEKALPRTGPLTPKTRVDETYRCNAETREFFKSVIGPHFHFTAHLQAFLKANRDKVLNYGDLAREWEAEYERRKDKTYRAPISKSWEYNQFTRDYFADAANSGRGMKEAAAAWKQIRTNNGPRTYKEYKKRS